MAKVKSYVVRVTEMNPREAIIKAASKKAAIEEAELLWNDPDLSYDLFKDIQELNHTTEVTGEASESDRNYLPTYPDDLE